MKSYKQELVNDGALISLMTAERDLATHAVTRQGALLKSWQSDAQRILGLEAKKERVGAEANE